MNRLVHAQPLVVGPLQRGLGLPRHLPRIHQRLELDVLRLGRGLEPLQEIAERIADPRHDDRPPLDAAKAVDALLERRPLHDVFDVVGARLAALPIDHHAPRPRLEGVGVLPRVGLVEAELVEIVVGGDVLVGVDLFVGAERALLQVGQLLRLGILRRQRRRAGEVEAVGRHGDRRAPRHREELPPPEIELLRRHVGFTKIGRLLDQHKNLRAAVFRLRASATADEKTHPTDDTAGYP